MIPSNPVSVKVPDTSGDFTMIARNQKHRVFVEVSQEGQCTGLRVTCQQTGREWWFEAFNGKLWRGFDPAKKIPKCELPAVEFHPVKKSFALSPTEGFVDCGGRYYAVPSNEPPDDGFIYEDTEPSDLARYNEPATDPMTWQEF